MEEARRTAESAWESYRVRLKKYDPSIEWIGGRRARIGFSAKGLNLKGELEIRPGRIDIVLDVPLVFRILKKRAVAVIEREIRAWEDRGKRENR
jgi:hypothetical protein